MTNKMDSTNANEESKSSTADSGVSTMQTESEETSVDDSQKDETLPNAQTSPEDEKQENPSASQKGDTKGKLWGKVPIAVHMYM